MKKYLLAIDQGTTNSRAIIFATSGKLVSIAEKPLTPSFPHPGWVEQNGLEMVANILYCCRAALAQAKLTAKDIAAVGITNQRETTILWNKKTGEPIYPAIVWQDRRTSQVCESLITHNDHDYICTATGLIVDPYFSATKIQWLLNEVRGARLAAERGDILFGTVDTFLIWHLTKEHNHVTDATNASRTMLFNIHSQTWDEKILAIFNIPKKILPEVLDCTANFGELAPHILGERIPIAGVAGDQQAATIGQACFQAGMMKTTYGTGGFLLLNTGEKIIRSQNKLLSTVAYRLAGNVTYGLEGSIFSTGETIKWLRDNLKIITTAQETQSLVANTHSNLGVYIIPAFTGLGAPHWRPDARAAIIGIERNVGREHLVRAALESVAYQTRDLLLAMQKDGVKDITRLRVDGGMVANNWLMQFLADMLAITVERPVCIETTALGAAFLAGLQVGVYQDLEEIANLWQVDKLCHPVMTQPERERNYRGWKIAMQRILGSDPI